MVKENPGSKLSVYLIRFASQKGHGSEGSTKLLKQ